MKVPPFSRRLCTLLGVFAVTGASATHDLIAETFTYDETGTQNWTSSTAWDPNGDPDGVGTVVNIIGAAGSTGAGVTLNEDRTVGVVNIGSQSTNEHRIRAGGGILTLDNGPDANALITTVSGGGGSNQIQPLIRIGVVPNTGRTLEILRPEGTGGLSFSAGFDVNGNNLLFNNAADVGVSGNVFVGSGTIEKRGTGILTLTGSSAFTGTLNIYEGSIYLDRNLGRFPTVGTINLGGYGVLQTDTSGNSQVSSDGIANMSIPRFNPDADINLDGGAILRFKGNVSLATGIINEQASTIKVNSGTPTLELGYASGADWQVNLEFSGIERQAGSALVVRAFNAIGGAEGVAGANRYTFEGGIETVGGTGAYNTTTAAIVPWMFGAPASSNNNANPGNNASSGFMTYSEEFGLQHVTTYQDNINNAAADENVSIGNATLNSTKTINALRTTTTANATLNLGTDHVLTIASGAMLIAANNYSIIGSGLSAINFGNREGIIFVGSSAGSTTVTPHTATISARLTNSGTNGFTKAGPGTLILEGANDYGGDTWVAGGVLRAGAANVLPAATGLNMANGGAPAFNANSVNFPEAARFDLNGFSQTIGSLSGGGEFGGDVLLNGATLTTGGNGRSTTYAGVISGSTAGSNLVKTGTGSFRLTGTNTYIGSTTVSDGTLIVDGSIAASSGVSVGAGARLKGTGQVSSISGAGTVAPGNSPGILTATEVNGAAGLDFDFEFTLANTATLDWQGDIENSVLRLTGDTPFVVNLNSSNVINLYLSGDLYASLSESTYLIGGFYTETGAAFDASVTGATINAFRDIGGGNYVAITSGFFSVSTVANSGLDEDGFVTRFDFTAVPEPSSAALWLLGIAGLAARRRRKS